MSSRRHGMWGLAAAALAIAAACTPGCATNVEAAAKDARLCTPNNYVYCRCENRDEGTKLCRADGASFEACNCAEPFDGSGEPPKPTERDASTKEDADVDACIGRLAVVGGHAGGVYSAIYKGSGKFQVASNATAGVSGAPTIVPVAAGGFHAIFRSATNALFSMTYTAGAFDAPSRIGTVTARDAPSVALLGADVHVVYRGGDGLHYQGKYSTAWDDATSPVAPGGAGGSHSFGPSSPSAAATDGTLAIVYSGADSVLYQQTFARANGPASAAWGAALPQIKATTATTRPKLINLVAGTSDLLVVYANVGDYKLRSMSRSRATKAWSDPVPVDPNAYTTDPVSLAPMSGGRAMMIYRGANQKPYFSVYDPSAATLWSVLGELVPGANPTVASSPGVTTGTCGDDAAAVFAQDNGAVGVQRYVGGAWTAPTLIPGMLNLVDVGIAEHP